jgi:hypothetical protein
MNNAILVACRHCNSAVPYALSAIDFVCGVAVLYKNPKAQILLAENNSLFNRVVRFAIFC